MVKLNTRGKKALSILSGAVLVGLTVVMTQYRPILIVVGLVAIALWAKYSLLIEEEDTL